MIHQISKIRHVDEQQEAIRDRVWVCCWNQTGQILATAGEDRTIKIWKFTTDVSMLDAKQNPTVLHSTLRGDQNRSIRCVCFSPCGRFLASASFDTTIVIYKYRREIEEWEDLHRLEGHENEVKCCAFSSSGHYLATCSRDKSVWVWRAEEDEDGTEDYEVLSILQSHTADVKFVVWHPREDILLSGSYDYSIRFYTFDGDDWTTAQAIPMAHDETVWSASFEPNAGRHLATIGGDRSIKIWTRSEEETKTGENSWRSWNKVADLQVQDSRWPLYSVAWSMPQGMGAKQKQIVGTQPDIGILAVGGGDGIVRMYSFDEANQALVLLSQIRMDSEINCLSWRPLRRRRRNVSSAADDDDKDVDENSTVPQLAVALDSGFVHLLQVGE